MSHSQYLHLASYAAVLSFAMAITLVGCGGGEGDNGSSGGSDSGGSDSGGSSSGGGDAGTGGQAGDGPFIGDACTDSSECPLLLGEYAGYCKTNWSGGYCSGTCNRSEDCGPGSVCHGGAGWCVKACEDDSECREGYSCYDDFGGCEPAL